MKQNSGRHLLAVATACILWGGSVIGTKLSYDSLAPMSLGLVRFLLSAILFFCLLALRRELTPPRGRDLTLIAASGLLGTTLYFAAENYGASLASGATSSLVIGSFPAMTLVLESIVDHTVPRPRIAGGVLLAFAGVCVLALADNSATGTDELVFTLASDASPATAKVGNKAGVPLPHTGGIGATPLGATGMLLVCLATALLLLRRRRLTFRVFFVTQ